MSRLETSEMPKFEDGTKRLSRISISSAHTTQSIGKLDIQITTLDSRSVRVFATKGLTTLNNSGSESKHASWRITIESTAHGLSTPKKTIFAQLVGVEKGNVRDTVIGLIKRLENEDTVPARQRRDGSYASSSLMNKYAYLFVAPPVLAVISQRLVADAQKVEVDVKRRLEGGSLY